MQPGKQIEKARRAKGLTQKDLATLAQVSHQVISKIEQGRGTPRPSTLLKIAEVLGITIESPKTEPESAITSNDYLHSLDPKRFAELALHLAKAEGLPNPEFFDGPYDGGRDIVCKGNEDSIFIQCKRVESYTPKKLETNLREEVEKILEFVRDSKSEVRLGKIIFCISRSVNSGTRTHVEEYARSLGLPQVLFWAKEEIHMMLIRHPHVLEEFFPGRTIQGANKRIEATYNSVTQISDKISQIDTKVEVFNPNHSFTKKKNRELNAARDLIKEGRYQEARKKLLSIEGEAIENADPDLPNIFNNLGVCLNQSSKRGGDIEEAVTYFEKALKINPQLVQAKKNLVAALLNLNDDSRTKLALKKIREFIADNPADRDFLLTVYIHALARNDETEALRDEIEKNSLTESCMDNEELCNVTLASLAQMGESEKAVQLAEEAVKSFPASAHIHAVYARALTIEAQKHDIENTHFRPIPRVLNPDRLLKALPHYKTAIELAEKEGQPVPFIEGLKSDYRIALTWVADKGAANELIEVVQSVLPKEKHDQLGVHDYAVALRERNFETAFRTVQKLELPYEKLRTIAEQFYWYGSPEHSTRILLGLRDHEMTRSDDLYWAILSSAYALAGDKNAALSTIEEAKRIFKDKPEEMNMFFSHTAALSMRYGSTEESDRLVINMMELQRNTDEQVFELIPVEEDSKQLVPQKVIDFIKQAGDDYRKAVDLFKKNAWPIYFLSKFFRKPYPQLFKFLPYGFGGSVNMDLFIPYNDMPRNPVHVKVLNESNVLIFEYAALVNLSKTHQLGLLQLMGKPIKVHFELFTTIQSDLLQQEDPVLRSLWNFLRTNTDIVEIIDPTPINDSDLFAIEGIENILDDWFVQSARFAKKTGYTFVCDDAHLVAHLNANGLKSVNTFALFLSNRERSVIDEKQFALIKGELAEHLYRFIPFSGIDLYYVAGADTDLKRDGTPLPLMLSFTDTDIKANSSLRFLHLLNQINIPDTNVESFYGAIFNFIRKLAQTGMLTEDKLNLLLVSTWVLIKYFESNVAPQLNAREDEATLFYDSMGAIWSTAYNEYPHQTQKDIRRLSREIFRSKTFLKPALERLERTFKS